MAYMTHQDAQVLISDLIDKVIEVTNPEGTFSFEKYMHVGEFSRAEEVSYIFGGFGLPQERQILEDIDYDVPVFGSKLTTTPIEYGRGFRVAREVIRDLADAGPHDGVNVARLGSYADYTKRLKRKGWERVDLECALKLINGTSTAAKYAGRPAGTNGTTPTALFSASHTTLGNPPITQSNLTTGSAFTAANLQTAITALDTQRDDQGDYISSPNSYNVIIPAAYRWKAIEITKTKGQVDTANNTVNPLVADSDVTINPIVVKTLDRANGSSYTGWFVQNASHTMNWKWREKPTFDKNVDFDARAIKYAMFMSGAHFHEDWRGVLGYPPS